MSVITEILTVTNEIGESIVFSRSSIFHVNFATDVTGLAEIENEIYSINSMGQDGDTYIGSRIKARDIGIAGYINLRDGVLMREYRRRLNHVINPKYTVTVKYEYGDFVRVIDGRVESVQFGKRKILQPFALEISCLNPFWRKTYKTRDDVASWLGSFQFPVKITPTWKMGYRQPSYIVNVENQGDVETGIKIEFRALGVVEVPKLLNVNTGEFIQINMTMAAGDVITVNTGYGEKDVSLYRGGETSDAFRYIDVDSSYMQLAVGDNLFRYSADAGLDNLEVSIYNDDLYLGV
jgi:hypothetical protein